MNVSNFSPAENKLLRILGYKKMTIEKLTAKYFEKEELPLNSNNIVAGIVLRINKKCEYHKLTWKIEGEGLGRSGKTVWRT